MAKKYKDLGFKEKLSYTLCVASFIVGVALTVAGFIVNPVGEVHPSVLTLLGLFLTFVGSILGISNHYSAELEKIKNTVNNSVKDDETI